MPFVSDTTAKNILRGLIRDATHLTPSIKELECKMQNLMQVSRNNEKLKESLGKYLQNFNIKYQKGGKREADHLNISLPNFSETEHGWSLTYREVHIFWKFNTKCYSVQTNDGDVSFTDHLLERIFQRARIISWEDVRQELDIVLICSHLWRYVRDKVKQVVVPSEKGLYLGDCVFENGRYMVRIKTFVNISQLGENQLAFKADYEAILAQLQRTWKTGSVDYATFSSTLTDSAEGLLVKYPWLLNEYQKSC